MVEWKELGALGKFENIGTDKKTIDGEQLVTLLNYVDVYHNKHIDATVPQMVVSASDQKIINCTVEQGDIFVTPSSETVDDIGHSAVIEETIPNAVYSYHLMRYRLFGRNMLLSYYINYAFDTENVKKQILKKAQGLTRFGLSKDKFSSIQIPIPSISVQQRIVDILDTFTSSIDNLKQQIEQRRKQYDYYREKLIDVNEGPEARLITLGEIGSFEKGSGIQKKDFVEEGVGCIHYGQIHTYYGLSTSETISNISKEQAKKCKKAQCGDIIIATTSEDVEGCAKAVAWLGNHEICISGDSLVFHHKENPKFIAYLFRMNYFQKFKRGRCTGAKVTRISAKALSDYPFVLPIKSKQAEIVSSLNIFEASIRNLEEQLNLREKQYEYYRNKLLTFE